MLLIVHILTAFSSLGFATAAHLQPSSAKLRATYLLTVAMLASGTALLIKSPSHLVESCIMGLGLLGVILYQVMLARQKLARTSVDKP
jgi:hypothetical protein